MAHAAKLNNDNIVEQVIVIPDNLDETESDTAVQAYCNSIGLAGTWIRTSYNASIRGKYAGIGDKYDPELDEFVSPVPSPAE